MIAIASDRTSFPAKYPPVFIFASDALSKTCAITESPEKPTAAAERAIVIIGFDV